MDSFDQLCDATGDLESKIAACVRAIAGAVPRFTANQVSYSRLLATVSSRTEYLAAMTAVGDGLASDFASTLALLNPLFDDYSKLHLEFLAALTSLKTHLEARRRWGDSEALKLRRSLDRTLDVLEQAHVEQCKFRDIIFNQPEYSSAFVTARDSTLAAYDRWIAELHGGVMFLRQNIP